MGREIVYCATCGNRILQEDFDQGKAITLNNKNYCPKCRKAVMPESEAPAAPEDDPDLRPLAVDRGKGSSALRRAVNVPLPPGTPARGSAAVGGRPPVRTAGRPRAGRGAARAPEKSSNTVVIVLVCIAVAVLILLLVLLSGKKTPRQAAGFMGIRIAQRACGETPDRPGPDRGREVAAAPIFVRRALAGRRRAGPP